MAPMLLENSGDGGDGETRGIVGVDSGAKETEGRHAGERTEF
jgi:hypothetical protein